MVRSFESFGYLSSIQVSQVENAMHHSIKTLFSTFETSFQSIAIVVALQSVLLYAGCTDIAQAADKAANKVTDKPGSEGWLLDRTNGLGHEVMEASKNGVKMTYPTVGLNVVCAAPDWNIVWYNTKSHKTYTETLAHYRFRKLLPQRVEQAQNRQLKMANFAGVKCQMMTIVENPGRQSGDLPSLSEKTNPGSGTVATSTYYVTEKVDLPQQELDFLATFYGMPNFGGIPLGCHQKLNDGKERFPWRAFTSKPAKIADSEFALPSGYLKTKNQTDVALSGELSKLESWMTDMKIGEEFGNIQTVVPHH